VIAPPWIAAVAFVLSALQASPVHAQAQPAPPQAPASAASAPAMQTIIVTGTKQNKSVFQTQQSVDVLTERELQERGITSVQEITSRSANVSQDDTRGLRIRGSTTTFQVDFVYRPNIAFIRDGVEGNVQNFVEQQGLWDVAQVELLKGSQTTAYGRNAIAGAVVINTADPTSTFEGKARAGAGSFDYRVLSAALSGPLGDKQITGRLSVDRQTIDEQHPNFYFGDTPLAASVVRGKLLFKPDALPGSSAKLTLEQTRGSLFDFFQEWVPSSQYVPGDLPEQAFNRFSAREPKKTTNNVVGLDIDVALGEQWALESVTGLSTRRTSSRFESNLCLSFFDGDTSFDGQDLGDYPSAPPRSVSNTARASVFDGALPPTTAAIAGAIRTTSSGFSRHPHASCSMPAPPATGATGASRSPPPIC
jgi:iron complex outermembrane recepter protein